MVHVVCRAIEHTRRTLSNENAATEKSTISKTNWVFLQIKLFTSLIIRFLSYNFCPFLCWIKSLNQRPLTINGSAGNYFRIILSFLDYNGLKNMHIPRIIFHFAARADITPTPKVLFMLLNYLGVCLFKFHNNMTSDFIRQKLPLRHDNNIRWRWCMWWKVQPQRPCSKLANYLVFVSFGNKQAEFHTRWLAPGQCFHKISVQSSWTKFDFCRETFITKDT